MNTATTAATTTYVSIRLPNSIPLCHDSWLVGTSEPGEQSGHEGQPSPELVSLTSPPVETITMFAISEASASRRTVMDVGRHWVAHKNGEAEEARGRAIAHRW
jgi:hypothetical protein